MKGIKESKNKPRWSLIPFGALKPVVRVLNFGATTKYKPDNWKHVEVKGAYLDAIVRHWTDYISGKEFDEEIKESHLACIIANALFLIWDRQQNPNQDFDKYLKNLLYYPDYVTELDINKFD